MQIIENPFDLTKASDFSDVQIKDYWVDITKESGGLVGFLKPKNPMPMFLLGSKGSGKTHLMRFCSSSVQILRNHNSISESIKREGYLGIYVRADALNVGRFWGKNQNPDTWYTVFAYYFEIWLVLNLLITLRSIITEDIEVETVRDITDLFDISIEIMNINELIKYLENIRKKIDSSVNNCAISGNLEEFKIIFSPGNLIFGIPEILKKNIDIFQSATILYLIDEAENFNEMQQEFLNTLVRYRRGNVSIRVGSRLYGIKTKKTHQHGEEIALGAEYAEIRLDKFLRDQKEAYKAFIKKLIQKRLIGSNLNTSFEDTTMLDDYFEYMDSENFYQKITQSIVILNEKTNSERKYLSRFRENLKKLGLNIDIEKVITTLSIPEYPLLEKINIYIFYQRISKKREDLLDMACKIKKEAMQVIQVKKKGYYLQKYKHFCDDMLAQLHREYHKAIPYAGLDTVIHLSQGTPRNALGILQHIYSRSLFNGEKPFDKEKISIQSQTEGIKDSADWFWNDTQPDEHGTSVKNAITNLAVYFRHIRYSDKPSECNLSSFSVDTGLLSEKAREILRNAENWSYLLRSSNGRKSKNSQRIEDSFQLAPMLAPRWGLSPKKGGTIEINDRLANAIFENDQAKLDAEIKRRLKNILSDYDIKIPKQQGLFDD
jgi:hypothetical protein